MFWLKHQLQKSSENQSFPADRHRGVTTCRVVEPHFDHVSGRTRVHMVRVRRRREGVKIAIIEDEVILAMALTLMLEDWGHQVIGTADTEIGAMVLVKDERPDLVVMDIRLGRRDNGLRAARLIRASSNVPIVFCTAYADSPRSRRRLQPSATPISSASRWTRTSSNGCCAASTSAAARSSARRPSLRRAFSAGVERPLEHIPSGRNRPDGICLLQQISPVRAFPFRWNRARRAMGQGTTVRARFPLNGNRSS